MTINFVLFLFPYIFAGVVVSIIAALMERLMISIGWMPGSTIFLVIFDVVAVALWEFLKFPEPISFNVLEVLSFTVFMPMAINRYDLFTTMQKGRWWWKSEIDAGKKDG